MATLLAKAPLNASLAFPLTTPSSHALRGQMSEVSRLIVMIMSLQRVGWGCSAGENVSRKVKLMERATKRRREWSGPERMSCHISCNPSSLALKTPHSLRIHNPCCHSNLTDEQASLTLNQSCLPTHPHPCSPWLFVMAWLGLFRGKLTMSGM